MPGAHNRVQFPGRWLLLGLCGLGMIRPAPAEPPAKGELIAQLKANAERTHSIAFDFTCDRYLFARALTAEEARGTSLTLPAHPALHYEGHYQRATTNTLLSYATTSFPEGTPRPAERVIAFWDGTRFWRESLPGPGDIDCPSRIVTDGSGGMLSIEGETPVGRVLDGFLPFADAPGLLQLAGEEDSVRIAEGSDGRETRLEAHQGTTQLSAEFGASPAGRLVRLVLQNRPKPEHGLRAQIEKFFPKLRYVFTATEADSIVYAEIDGVAIPAEGRILTTAKLNDGSAASTLLIVRRSNIRLSSPDDATVQLPAAWSGTLWHDSADMTQRVLRDGELSPALDAGSARRVAEAAEALRSEGQRAPAALKDFIRPVVAPGSAPAALPVAARSTSTLCQDAYSQAAPIYGLLLLKSLRGEATTPTQLLRMEQAGTADSKGLTRAARLAGLQVRPFAGLTAIGLRHSPLPLLLSVRVYASDQHYAGWTLFLGTNGDRATLFSPAEGLHEESLDRLIGNWNGNGLALGARPTGRLALRRAELIWFGGFGLALLAAAFGVGWWLRGRGSARRTEPVAKRLRFASGEGVAFVSAALVFGFAWNGLGPQGLLNWPSATAAIHASRAGFLAPEVGTAEMAKLSADPAGPVILDARDPLSFHAGHIPRALSVPVASSEAQFADAVAGLDRDAPVTVYCGERECHMADYLAGRLADAGFRQLRIYRGGWKAWSEAMPADRIAY